LLSPRGGVLNPKKQGNLAALDQMRNPTCTLNQLSWACAEGQLINKKINSVFLWKPSPMVLPVSRSAKHYFGSEYYINKVKDQKNSVNFKINKGYKKQFDSNWKAI